MLRLWFVWNEWMSWMRCLFAGLCRSRRRLLALNKINFTDGCEDMWEGIEKYESENGWEYEGWVDGSVDVEAVSVISHYIDIILLYLLSRLQLEVNMLLANVDIFDNGEKIFVSNRA